MHNRFNVSPDFTIERARPARNIETVTAPGYNITPEMAAFIAAILATARAEFLDGIRLALHGTILPTAK
jgi:hypothetical protein